MSDKIKIERKPCPYCAESIPLIAKKCRFCGSILVEEKHPASIKIPYIVWSVSILLFFLTALLMWKAENNGHVASIYVYVYGVVVLIGSVSFLMLIGNILNNLKLRATKQYGIITIATFVGFFILFFNFESVMAKLGIKSPETKSVTISLPSSSPNPTQSPTPKPIIRKTNNATTTPQNTSGQIICTGPDGKTFNTTQQKCDEFNTAWGNPPTPNPDEMIKCNIHANCGGGYKEMLRKSCDDITCCSLKSGNILTSRSDCKDKQYRECIDTVMNLGSPLGSAMDICKK